AGAFQQGFFFHSAAVPFLNEYLLDFSDRLLCPVVYFDNDLVDDGPVTVFDSPNDVQLALFSIDLEQTDSVNLVLSDDIGNGCQPALARGLAEPVVSEFTHILFQRLVPFRRSASQN